MLYLKKFLLFGIIAIGGISLTGCVHIGEYAEVRKEAIEIAKEYIEDKYGEKFYPQGIKVDSKISYGVFDESPSGAVILYNRNREYSVYVNVETGVVADDKQLKMIKDDIADKYLSGSVLDLTHKVLRFEVYGINPYILAQPSTRGQYFTKEMYYQGDINEFLKDNDIGVSLNIHFKSNKNITTDNEFNHYLSKFEEFVEPIIQDFNGEYSSLKMYLYKPDKYMNEDVKTILNQNANGVASIWDDYIYSPFYTYLRVIAETKRDNVGVPQWSANYLYNKFIEIDEGLYVASNYNRKFESSDDIVLSKYPIYGLTDRLSIFIDENESLEMFVDEELIEEKRVNSDGEIVLTEIYQINYGPNVFEEAEENIELAIDKKTFEDGLLLNEENVLKIVYADDRGSFDTYRVSDNFTYEDDNYIYVSIPANKTFAVCTGVND